MATLKLPYGIKRNNLVSIDEVGNGLSCECTCPACGQTLIARKGDIKIHHFAHYNSKDCLGGFETALHQMCKEIIFNSKTFATPPLHFHQTSYEIFEEQIISVDDVHLEKRLGGIIPDIVINSKGRQLLVEIVASNPVDEIKLRKIQAANVGTIVIYAKHLLSNLYLKGDFRLKSPNFQNEIVHGTKYKFWLHNPKLDSLKCRIKNEFAQKKLIRYFNGDFGKYFFVDNCPLQKRQWRRGLNAGKPFASLDNDCCQCPFILGIDHEYNNWDVEVPKMLYCCGHMKSEFRQLIAKLK